MAERGGKVKKVERLEVIAMKLEKVKKGNPVIDDLRWLASELRKAWQKGEEDD